MRGLVRIWRHGIIATQMATPRECVYAANHIVFVDAHREYWAFDIHSKMSIHLWQIR